MKVKKNTLANFYTIEPNSGNYIVEIGVHELKDIFNSWIDSPFEIRELDPDLKRYLEKCSDEIDLDSSLTIRLNITQHQVKGMEEKVKKGIQNDFYHTLYKMEEELKARRKKTGIYVLLALFLIFTTVYLQALEGRSIFSEILLYSLSIGSWVFLWEAFSIFFQYSDIIKSKKRLLRLLKSQILFRYKNTFHSSQKK